MLNLKRQKAATCPQGGVLVGELGGKPVLVRYAPQSFGNPENRAALQACIDVAARRLGWTRDRRCKGGYRRIAR